MVSFGVHLQNIFCDGDRSKSPTNCLVNNTFGNVLGFSLPKWETPLFLLFERKWNQKFCGCYIWRKRRSSNSHWVLVTPGKPRKSKVLKWALRKRIFFLSWCRTFSFDLKPQRDLSGDIWSDGGGWQLSLTPCKNLHLKFHFQKSPGSRAFLNHFHHSGVTECSFKVCVRATKARNGHVAL